MALFCAWWAAPAQAVILTVSDNNATYSLFLRVGSAGDGVIDTVTFNATGTKAGLDLTPVAGTPDIGVWVQPLRNVSLDALNTRAVHLAVNSPSAGLTCQTPASCGTVSIPFNKISWTVSNNAGDISNGTFNGTGVNQTIASFNANASFCDGIYLLGACIPVLTAGWVYQTNQMQNTRLHFSYLNNEIYPAGSYRGRVVFTATMP